MIFMKKKLLENLIRDKLPLNINRVISLVFHSFIYSAIVIEDLLCSSLKIYYYTVCVRKNLFVLHGKEEEWMKYLDCLF